MEKPIKEQSATRHDPTLGKLFLSFLRLGLTAFGGPAMMAHVSELAVKKQKWLDPPTFRNGVVLAQSIPGATVMQAVAYVGLQTRGVRGALASYIGFGLPAFLLMLVFSLLYAVSRSLPWVASVFSGLQVIVVAIVANATFTFGKTSLKHYMQAGLAAASVLAFGLGVSPFYVILGAAICGMLLLRDNAEEGPETGRHKPFPFVQIGVLLSVLAGGLVGLYVLIPSLFRLALLMLKIDLFAFGGGFASLPLMLQEVVHVNGWLDARTFMDGIALGQITPGPIVITSTFVGYLTYHLPGAVVATVSIFAPSFILLVLTAPVFHRLKRYPFFIRATQGVLGSFVGLLLFATISFAFAVPWSVIRVCIGVAALAALLKKVDLVYIVLIGAALSMFLFRA